MDRGIMMREEITKALAERKLIVIVRGVSAEQILPLAGALYEGGIRFMEVTFDPSGKCSDEETARKIALLCEKYGDRMYFGAGTVLTEQQVACAKEAGAEYIISPDTNPAVIRKTKELGMLSMPGAFTPTEAMVAHTAGADYVKLFPVGELGVSYFKAVRAPLNHLKLLAVGGVSLSNIADYLAAGAYGFGIGSSLVDKKMIERGCFDEITKLAAKYVQAVEHAAERLS